MAEVSVVLPVFNAARTIVRAVRSILDQTSTDLELIVVDDGSSDETVSLVRKIRDPRLRVAACAHRHVAAAANEGLAMSNAPVVARMDADDVAHPQRLARQLAWLRDHALDVVGCQVRIADAGGQRVSSLQRYERWINEETLNPARMAALRFVELPVVNPSLLARREYFELGFRHGDYPEDYDLMLRGAAAGFRFGKVPDVLLDWTDGPARLTRTDPRYSPAAFDRCRRRHLLDGPLQGVPVVDLWGVGRTGKPWLRWFQSQSIAVRRCYDIADRKIGRHVHGVRVVHVDDLPAAGGAPLIIAVGAAGARDLIRPHLRTRGYVSGENAWFVA